MKPIKTSHITFGAALIVAVFGCVLFVQSAQAGPVTNPGGPPYIKMAVYQGVLSIVPGGTSDGVLEIGNAGRDIAGTQDIYIRPSNIGGASESSSNFARFYSDTGTGAGKTSLTVPGDLSTQRLCINGDCKTAWPTGAGSTPVVNHWVGNLAANAAQAMRFEVARIAFVSEQWTQNTSVFIELREKYWGSGGYKKYEVWAGYYDDYGINLVEATGSKKQPNTMADSRVSIGTPVATGTNLAGYATKYIPVYIDVDNYTSWDVTVTHNMTETSNILPSWGQIHFYDSPTGTAISSFNETDIVTHIGTTAFGPEDDRGAGGASQGGEIRLLGAVSSATYPSPTYSNWSLDVYQSRFRIFPTGGTEKFAIDSDGTLTVSQSSTKFTRIDSNGHLLVFEGLYQADATNFGSFVVSRPTAASNLAYIGMRDPYAAYGFGMNSAHQLYIGRVTGSSTSPSVNPDMVMGTNGRVGIGGTIQPMAQLAVNNNLTAGGGQFDTIGAYNNNGGTVAGTQGSAIYAQQNNIMGYAGYYSGSVKIVGGASSDLSAYVPHYTLEVVNTSGINNSPNAMLVAGGDADSTGSNSTALSVVAGRAGISSPSTYKTYGLVVQRGYGQGSNYAALFIGKIMKKTSQSSSYPGEVPTLQWAVGGTSCVAECGYSGQECWLTVNKPATTSDVGQFNSCTWTVGDRLCFCNNVNSASYGGL